MVNNYTINFTNEEVDKMNSYEREIYAKNQEITRKDKEISKLTEELNNLKNNKKSS